MDSSFSMDKARIHYQTREKGPVSTEVDIETKGGERVVASITTASADSLKLEVGKKVYAVIKVSNVMVGTDE